MSLPKPITKAQRDIITAHLANHKLVTQRDAMKRLRITSHNNFYRLAYRVMRANY